MERIVVLTVTLDYTENKKWAQRHKMIKRDLRTLNPILLFHEVLSCQQLSYFWSLYFNISYLNLKTNTSTSSSMMRGYFSTGTHMYNLNTQ